jgi:arginase
MTTILVPYHHDERLSDIDIHPAPDLVVEPEFPGSGDTLRRVTAVCAATATAVEPVVAAGRVPLVLSGDCLVTGGTVAGVQRAGVDPAVVWFDAHGDVHTVETSTSGYLGGLSLRLLTGAHTDLYADRFGLRPLPPGRAVLVDARDLDPAEADYLSTSDTRRIPVSEVDGEAAPDGPFVLHVDVDVIDAGELAGLRFPAPEGPSADVVLAACGRLLASGRVVAVDVACTWQAARTEEERAVRGALVARLADLM